MYMEAGGIVERALDLKKKKKKKLVPPFTYLKKIFSSF